MISKRTVRLIKNLLIVASGSGFFPYKWDSVINQIVSKGYWANLLSNLICSIYVLSLVCLLALVMFNMVTRTTAVPDLILGIFTFSLMFMAMCIYWVFIVLGEEAIHLTNTVLFLSKQFDPYYKIPEVDSDGIDKFGEPLLLLLSYMVIISPLIFIFVFDDFPNLFAHLKSGNIWIDMGFTIFFVWGTLGVALFLEIGTLVGLIILKSGLTWATKAAWRPRMSDEKKQQSIQNFRTLQIIHGHTLRFFDMLLPPLMVVGEILLGSLLFSIIKFHDRIDFYLEMGLMGLCCMVVLALREILGCAYSVYKAHIGYSMSILKQGKKLNRLEWCLYRAFPVRVIRIPYLLTLTKRTFLTLAQTVFYNVISLLVAFRK